MGEEVEKLRIRQWRTQGAEVVILLTGHPTGDGDGKLLHRAVHAFSRELAGGQAPAEDLDLAADINHHGFICALAERDVAQAQVEAMRKALEPIFSRDIGGRWPDDACVVIEGRIGGERTPITVGQWRAAMAALSAPEEEGKGDGSARDHAPTPGAALEGLAEYLHDQALLADDTAKQRVGGQRNRLIQEAEDCRRWATALASSTPESVNSRLLGALAPFAAAGEQFRRTRSPIDHECMAAPIGLMVGDFLEAYAAFHATAQAEESSSKPEWRPIETAPKDGTWFLAHGDGDGWENCSFVCEWTEVGGWRECPGDYAALPTRWLPLPAAPTEARGDQPEGGQ